MSRIAERDVRWAHHTQWLALLALYLIGYAQTDTWPPRIALIAVYLAASVADGWVMGSYEVLQTRVALSRDVR